MDRPIADLIENLVVFELAAYHTKDNDDVRDKYIDTIQHIKKEINERLERNCCNENTK